MSVSQVWIWDWLSAGPDDVERPALPGVSPPGSARELRCVHRWPSVGDRAQDRQPYGLAIRSNHTLRMLSDQGLLHTAPKEMAAGLADDAWQAKAPRAPGSTTGPLSACPMPATQAMPVTFSSADAGPTRRLSESVQE